MRLEDIAAGGILVGLDADGAADVIAVRWIGRDALDVAYRVNGVTRSRVLMRSEELLLTAGGSDDGEIGDGDELRPVRWLLQSFEWLYTQALEGIPGAEHGIEHLAQSYRAQYSVDDDAIKALVSWQVAKAGVAGFMTNVGGILTLPVAIPANVVSVLYVQIRMVAAIAHMRGYDLRQDQVRTFVFASLAGSAAFDILKDVGIKLGTRVTRQMILRISGELLRQINRAVGFRLVTKAGSRGVINLVKVIPVVSGFVGGGLDAAFTKAIGNTAKKMFVQLEKLNDDPPTT